MSVRRFSTLRTLQHSNPLGLPRSNVPPPIPRKLGQLPPKRKINGVDKIVAISSAKGGVGKSTIAANISISFARLGLRAGLLDADVFGPSVPTLFNLSGEPRLSADGKLLPLTNYGVKSMSTGYLVGDGAPVIWRGLLVMKAVQQLLWDVEWGGLDVLVIDLPPGTSDVHLTISQQVLLDGAVVVTTPQDLALKDAIRGLNMFNKVNVPVLGIVENMSYFQCPDCQSRTPIFKRRDGSTPLTELGVPLLGSLPLDQKICADADRGQPTVVAEPTHDRAKRFDDITRQLRNLLHL